MLQIYLIGAIALLATLSIGYFYIDSLKNKLEVAELNQKTLKGVVDAEQEKTKKLQADIDTAKEIQGKMFTELALAKQDRIRLEKQFTETKTGKVRDFGNLAAKKPGLVENAINKGTRDSFRCNEILTGSPLTKAEESGAVKNSICPDLIGKKK